jgi:hypothetical protein
MHDLHRRGVHGHPPGGRSQAGVLQGDPSGQAGVQGVRGHREGSGGRGGPGVHHPGDVGGDEDSRRDQRRQAKGEVPQRGQPHVRRPDAHRQGIRAGQGREQGHPRANGTAPNGLRRRRSAGDGRTSHGHQAENPAERASPRSSSRSTRTTCGSKGSARGAEEPAKASSATGSHPK